MRAKERISTELELMASRIRHGLENGKYTWRDLSAGFSQKSKRAASVADYFVHDHTWKILGATAGLALAGGFMLAKRRHPIARLVLRRNPLAMAAATFQVAQKVLPVALLIWKAVKKRQVRQPGGQVFSDASPRDALRGR